MQWLVVACNQGDLFILDVSSGHVLGFLQAGGSIVAPPTIDPWIGHIWVGTHSDQLLCIGVTTPQAAGEPLSLRLTSSAVQYLMHILVAWM